MRIILLLLPLFLIAEEFITNEEYGKMLYENPRGIGCIKCHNKNGKGKVIANYYIIDKDNKKIKKQIIAPKINSLTLEKFYLRVKEGKVLKNGKYRKINYGVMPKYNYLTRSEIEAIYFYLKGKL